MHKDENTRRRRPSQSSLSLGSGRRRRRVVSVFSAAAAHTTRRHTVPAVFPFPPLLSHSPLLCWIYASEREVIRKSCPSGTNSILPPPPSPRSNNRQFMRRAPLLFTPKRRPPSLPLSVARRLRCLPVCSVPRPSPVRRLAMHEESDEIPLPLSLASYSSSSLCITMCGTP